MIQKRRHPKPRRAVPHGFPRPFTLSDDYRAWIVENATRGLDPGEIVRALESGGVPRNIASREVQAILSSPAMPGARSLARDLERHELLARLLRSVASEDTSGGAIERRETLSGADFYDHYYARNRPVILTRILDGWPALTKWSPAYFAERFGDVPVEVQTGRDTDPRHDVLMDAHRQTMTMRDFVDRVLSAGASNDIYMVSNNRALELPALGPLLDDLTPPADIFATDALKGAASLWFGPAGTRTALHHDTTNNLVCQIRGKKRFVLISPLETALLPRARGYFCDADVADLSAAGLGDVRCHTIELSAGEALFIPAGWWHEVTALEISIHISLLAFRRPSSMPWYRPGAVTGAPK